MTRLSSKLTFYVKKIFPGFLAGLLLFITFSFGRELLTNGFSSNHLPFLLFYALLSSGSYWLISRLCLPILDQVWIDGDDLHIYNWSDEVRVPVSDIVSISNRYGQYMILRLSEEYPFKRDMMFLPKLELLNPSFHEDIRLLTDKIAVSSD
ncbi:MAG: hypothetical protein ACRBF0_22990 [Calditrichia bacterium]